MIIALIMLVNVWMSSGRTRRSSSPTPRNVLERSRPIPTRPPPVVGRFLPSRQNTIFSVSMLWFMVGTAHFYNGADFASS